jgi:hypothetical protein
LETLIDKLESQASNYCMSEIERRAILEAVARGDLTPEEGAHRLRAALHDLSADPHEPHDQGEPETQETPTPAASRERPVRSSVKHGRRVRVDANAGSVRIVGDPSVTVVDVDGDHEVQEDGDTVVVRCTPLRDLDLDIDAAWGGWGHGHRGGRRGFAIHPPRVRVDDLKRRFQVTVRVNPELPLDAHVAAGAVSVRGVRAPISCDVDAGAARLHDVSGALDARVNAGALSIDGRLVDDSWRVRGDMGAVTIRLDPNSDARVRAHVNLGRCDIRLPTAVARGDEYVLGAGRGLLELDGSMASVSVAVDGDS